MSAPGNSGLSADEEFGLAIEVITFNLPDARLVMSSTRAIVKSLLPPDKTLAFDVGKAR